VFRLAQRAFGVRQLVYPEHSEGLPLCWGIFNPGETLARESAFLFS